MYKCHYTADAQERQSLSLPVTLNMAKDLTAAKIGVILLTVIKEGFP